MPKGLPLLHLLSLLILPLVGDPGFAAEAPRKQFKTCELLLSQSFKEIFTTRPDLGPEEARTIAKSMVEKKKQELANAIVNSWHSSKFTDPREPESNFLYLVHGILDDAEIEWKTLGRVTLGVTPKRISLMRDSLTYRNDNRKYLKDALQEHSALMQKLMADPGLISTFPGISASVINFEKRTTFANSGFILEPDIENIFATFYHDMGGKIRSFEGLMYRNEQMPIDTPENILEATERYNEIALAGTSPSGHKLRVIGLFVKTDSHGRPTCSKKRWDDFQRLSTEKNLPIVLITDPASANLNRVY